jgi:MFS family permease
VLFFTNGAVFASLLPRYPELKDALGLGNGAFGIAVAMFPLGALLAGLGAAPLLRRWSSGTVAVATTVLSSVGMLVAGLAPAAVVLGGGLFVAGAADAVTDVAQNAHGLRVQRRYGRSILNSFHAAWCVGAVSGGALGTLAAGAEVPRSWHLGVSAAGCALLALLARRWFLPGPDGSADDGTQDAGSLPDPRRRAHRAPWALLGALVLIASAGALVEDAGATWAAIYLTAGLGASATVAGLGFVALQGMQLLGRLVGDRLVDRFGQRAVARCGGMLVMVAMSVSLVWPTTVGTIVGFGLAGLGVSTLIPAAMHAADELPGLRPGTGLTVVGWLLRLGILVSPPVVGTLADATSLRVGLAVVPLAGLTVVALAPVLAGRGARRPRPGRTPAEPEPLPAAPVSRSLTDPGVLILSGEVDHAVLGALARELGVSSAELPRAIADVHTVDASRLTYADSRVLGLLASIAEDTRATGTGSLTVVGASPTLHRMIDLVGLGGRITHAPQPVAGS